MTGSLAGGQYPVAEWGADVDWITQVYDDRHEAERALWRAETWIEGERCRGNKVSGFGLAGFLGSSAGGVAVGRRGSSVLVQATSQRAGDVFSLVRGLGGHTTRLDLALTCRLMDGRCVPPVDAYRAKPAQSGRGRKTVAKTLIVNTSGGSTCYVGAATSEQRLRIYDKGAESGAAPPGQLWRWELQLRRKRAMRYAAPVDDAPTRKSAVCNAVLQHVESLGLRAPCCDIERPHICGLQQESDSAGTLRWLELGVAPSVRRLLMFYDRPTILAALGLSESSPAESADSINGGSDSGRW